jgi:SAM-dependent methyltransferase
MVLRKLVELNDDILRWSKRGKISWVFQAAIHVIISLLEKIYDVFGYETLVEERIIEYPMVFIALSKLKNAKVLDAGCYTSRLPLQLASLGYKTWTIDLKKYPFSHPNLNVKQENVTKTSFPDSFFDAVISISVIEHVGLGAYGEQKIPNGDKKAIAELTRILKPGGLMIISAPFGKRFTGRDYRVYDRESLNFLFTDLEKVEERYFLRRSNSCWIPSSIESCEQTSSEKLPVNAVAFLVLRKPF